ncbi:DNA replication licensing factor, MCM2/3/5 family [Thermococcus kodakarensis KOD1]|uniref:DNA replication licensing factor, MCM2/3/5 family n=1 Tax=Thermococcus kodakarensis (strain ATCC BAA-918 / JCM 12380 / KOD1) TaxID=69014 RepID=Q5JGW1_THEKO|nr:minichromosome maintenance protein MCM [Thermococcus kodakarensis]WCN27340.1 minichromosome maintenance protein MCM [Thermococcus kodakarensis]WCN29629.1 minichromosome maintenance protein MCM [Thermococcus kodakarensis]BAD85550.1 DNA replication licensing factor, MCM2/3/5 family [Thermococcus kodakarensis KOD1]
MLTKVTDVTGEISENKDNSGVTNEMYRNVTEVTEKYRNVIEFLNLIQKAFNLQRTVEALPYYVLWTNGRLSLTKLKEIMEEYNSHLPKPYTHSSLKVALSVLRRDKTNVLEVKDKELGITYYELKPEAVEEILNVLQVEAKLRELEEAKAKDHEDLVNLAREFFREFYRDRIAEALTGSRDRFIVVDWMELNAVLPQLAEAVVERPVVAIKAFNDALRRFVEEDLMVEVRGEWSVHFTNLRDKLKPEDVRAEHVGKLVEIKGLVTGVSNVRSFYRKAVFVCLDCGARMARLQQPLKPLVRPKRCEACGSRNVELLEEESDKLDFQFFKVQDSPEDLSGGEPSERLAYVIGPQAGILKGGMRVRLSAIVRERVYKKDDLPVYERVLEVNHVEVLDKAMSVEELSEEDLRRVRELARVHGDKLPFVVASSIAPNLYGLEREKLGAAVSIVGGVPTQAKPRGHIHLLLVGDPGCGKTELLGAVERVAPKAIFTSGPGSSGVGLTATVKRNEVSKGDWMIVGGALVLASGGVCLIDELEKMKEDERKALHTAMEQQLIPINKAGINVVLKIDTTIMATANPKGGKFDRDKTVIEQIDFPPTLLNRFDLAFVVLDDYQEGDDVLDYVMEVNDAGAAGPIPEDLLRKFFVYARSLRPRFSEEAKEAIKAGFKELRKKYKSGKIALNLRYFNGLMRIAEAFAKLRLSETVEPVDVERAVNLFESSIRMIAYDPETDQYDLAILEVGVPSDVLDLQERVIGFLREASSWFPNGVPWGTVVDAMVEKGYPKEKVVQVLRDLMTHGRVAEVEANRLKLVG